MRVFRTVCPNRFFSFPKSGRTWTKSVLERYFEELGGIGHGKLDFATWTPFLPLGRWSLAPGLVFSHGIYLHPRIDDMRRVVRRQKRARILFQVRDPRDVFLTYYFQRVRRPRGEPAVTADLATFLRDERYGIRRIVDYMNLWYDARETCRDFHLLRYEDAREDPMDRFSGVLRFLRRPVDDRVLRNAVETVPDTTRDVEVGGLDMLERIRGGEPDLRAPAGEWEHQQLARCEDVLSARDLEYLEEQAQALHPALGYTARS